MNDQEIESLQWAIEQQKADYENILNILRSYFVAVVTVIALSGFAVFRATNATFAENNSTITEKGLLWQTNILSDNWGLVSSDILSTYASIFLGIGVGWIIASLATVISAERSPKCDPIGNSSSLIDRGSTQLVDWIKYNDEILYELDELRKDTFQLGKHGATLIFVSYAVQVTAGILAPVSFALVFYLVIEVYKAFRESRFFRGTTIEKTFVPIIVLLLTTEPFTAYQDVYGYFPIVYRILLLIPTPIIVAFYFRSEIRSYMAENTDSWQRKVEHILHRLR